LSRFGVIVNKKENKQMSHLHDLYLVACERKSSLADSEQTRLGLSELREKEKLALRAGKEEKNTALALTYSTAFEANLSLADRKLASKNATEAQGYARLAIEQYKSNRAKKEGVKQQIADLESIRKKDEEELKIIKISTNRSSSLTTSFSRNSEVEPELSAARKLYYNAAKAMERETK
jgi:hypothetical protein